MVKKLCFINVLKLLKSLKSLKSNVILKFLKLLDRFRCVASAASDSFFLVGEMFFDKYLWNVLLVCAVALVAYQKWLTPLMIGGGVLEGEGEGGGGGGGGGGEGGGTMITLQRLFMESYPLL